MDTSQNITETPAQKIGEAIRSGRKKQRLTIADLSEQIGRPREWLNRVELGYSDFGEHRPPSQSDLGAIYEVIGQNLEINKAELLSLGRRAEGEFETYKLHRRPNKRQSSGKQIQAEVIIGEKAVVDAIINLIEEQHSDAVIRNVGIRGQGNYVKRGEEWNRYRDAMGKFLKDNPNSIFKRVEHVSNNDFLQMAKETDSRLAYKKSVDEVYNARVKFRKNNPLSIHLLIGQREAILGLPRSSGVIGSNIALLVRDKLFVEALRSWYDEVLWEGQEPSINIDYQQYDKSFEKVKKMYGFRD